MDLLCFVTFVLIHFLSIPGHILASETSWWLLGTSAGELSLNSIHDQEETSPNVFKTICRTQAFLGEKQKELCLKDRNILKTVAEGAALGIGECQHQFAQSRWNCPVSTNSTSLFGSVLTIHSREKAYVYAVNAAGVAYSVTKTCSQGEIAGCGCDNRIKNAPTNNRFEWGGCSDDILFGEKFSRDFVDSKDGKRSAEMLMNLHNNQAGRKHLRDNLQVLCKCHGVSGSCSIKICWRKLPNFRAVGDSLMKKFDGAYMVKMNGKKGKLSPKHRGQKYPSENDLVYLHASPSYCERNAKYGITGTRGRVCNQTSNDIDGCGLLCCGRGYRTMIRTEEKDCRCKFVWCCKVKCDKCKEETEEHICN